VFPRFFVVFQLFGNNLLDGYLLRNAGIWALGRRLRKQYGNILMFVWCEMVRQKKGWKVYVVDVFAIRTHFFVVFRSIFLYSFNRHFSTFFLNVYVVDIESKLVQIVVDVALPLLGAETKNKIPANKVPANKVARNPS
jgi:membrane protease YdiL (CAAX protease family)